LGYPDRAEEGLFINEFTLISNTKNCVIEAQSNAMYVLLIVTAYGLVSTSSAGISSRTQA